MHCGSFGRFRKIPTMTIDQLIQQANELHARGNLQQAEQLCQEVLKEVPNYPRALYLLGVIAGQQGQLPRAAEWLRQALASDPSDPLIHGNLANALAGLGQLEAAESHYREALRLR